MTTTTDQDRRSVRVMLCFRGDPPSAEMLEVIDGDHEFAMSAFIGGPLFVIDLGGGLAAWCNDDAIELGLRPNRIVPSGERAGEEILGDFLLGRYDGGELRSLTEEDLQRIHKMWGAAPSTSY